MAHSAVIGDGPVRYTRPDGTMILVPLTDLYFDDNGTLTPVIHSPLTGGDVAGLNVLLAFLVQSGQLTPAASPPPQAAMVITAAGTGAVYNGVTVEFKSVVPLTNKFDITVTKNEVYTGLSWDSTKPNYIVNVLGVVDANGVTVSPGTKDSLVMTTVAQTPSKPKAFPTPGTVLTGATSTVPGTLPIQATGAAFALTAFKPGAGGGRITIIIPAASIDTAKSTFDLNVSWSKPLSAVTKADVQADTDIAFLIKVTDPPPPGSAGVPRAGTVVLAGGTDPMAATSAGATVFTL